MRRFALRLAVLVVFAAPFLLLAELVPDHAATDRPEVGLRRQTVTSETAPSGAADSIRPPRARLAPVKPAAGRPAAPVAAPDAPVLTISVRLSGRAEPVAGVAVRVMRETVCVAEVESDAAGRARFAGLRAGHYRVETAGERYPPVAKTVAIGREAASRVVLTLDPGVALRVQVVEAPGGAARAGVRLCLRLPEIGLAREGRSDARGRLTLHGVPGDAWGRAVITASCAGWLQLRDPAGAMFTRTGPAEVRVRMLRAARLSGRLTAEDGGPIAGALVHLDLEQTRCPHLAPLAGHRLEGKVAVREESSARSDSAGCFALRGLPPGGCCVVGIRAPGCAPARRLFALDPGEERRDVSIRLARGVEIRGVVLGPAGECVGSTRILLARAGRLVAGVTADAAGEFRITGLAPGRVTLKARGEGVADSRPITLEIRAGASAEPVRLKLRRFVAAIRGRVVGTDGRGLAGFEVAAHPLRRPGLLAGETFQPPTAETDADGRFRLDGIQPGWTYRLEAARPGQRLPLVCGPLAPPVAPLSLVWNGLGTIDVVPGPDLDADITRVSLTSSQRPEASTSRAFRAWPLRFSGLPAGEYRVAAWCEGERVAVADAVRVAAGGAPAMARLQPTVGRAICGRVTDAVGRPLAAAPVAVLQRTAGERLARRTTTTDADGRFRLGGLAGEAVDLVVGGDGRGCAVRENVPIGASNLAIVFAPDCTVRVVVQAADGGAPLSRAEVGLVTAGLGAMRRRTDSGGRAVFRVTPGIYALVVRADGYQPSGCRIPVQPAGREVTREFRLVRSDLQDDVGGRGAQGLDGR